MKSHSAQNETRLSNDRAGIKIYSAEQCRANLSITNGTVAGAHLRNLARYFGDPNASIDLSTIGLGNLKTILYFKSKNIFNKMMVAYAADSLPGVTTSVSGDTLTLHYQQGVSTVARGEAATNATDRGTLPAPDPSYTLKAEDEFLATMLAGAHGVEMNATAELEYVDSINGLVTVSGSTATHRQANLHTTPTIGACSSGEPRSAMATGLRFLGTTETTGHRYLDN